MLALLPMLPALGEVATPAVGRRVEKLGNGLTVVTIPRDPLPLTTFALFLGRGSAGDPAAHPGV